MILTDIGEIGITVDGQRYILRPSLFCMTQLGDPEEIVRVYASVMHDQPHPAQFFDALAVIYACADDDLSHLYGAINEAGGFTKGLAPETDVIPLARCLLKHGVIGDYEPLPQPDHEPKDYVPEFNARDHVALAMAHLGMSSKEAWSITMTELVGALRAKFPQAEIEAKKNAERYPDQASLAELMAYHDEVLKQERNNHG